MNAKLRPSGPWPWLTDRLRELPDMEERRMFGCTAFYRAGRLRLVLTGEAEEPWNGVLACTGREHHDALRADFPALDSHAVLGKWLYVSCDHPDFEKVAAGLVKLVAGDDPLLGVEPRPKRRRVKPGRPSGKNQKSR